MLFFSSSSNERLTHNEIIQNWRTITAPNTLLGQIDYDAPKPATDLTCDPSPFVLAPSEDTLKLEEESSNTTHSTRTNSTDSFVDAGDDDYAASTAVIELSDEQIIDLAKNIQISFPGLPNAKAGFDTIMQLPDETPLVFAKRRLSAIKPPLLPLSSVEETYHQKVKAINDWHAANFDSQSDSECALAETCYLFEEKQKRLVIRHTPLQVDTLENERRASLLQNVVTHHIIDALHIPLSQLDIHHVTPTIQPGFQSLHIILTLKDEITNHEAKVDPKERFPFLNLLFQSDPHYHYLSVQNLSNNSDCGRYVTIMATVTMRLLIENKKQSVKNLALEDYQPFMTLIKQAPTCQNTAHFKQLLTKTEYIGIQSQHSAAVKQPPMPSTVVTQAFFKMAAVVNDGARMLLGQPSSEKARKNVIKNSDDPASSTSFH